jgi:hypothetical protein
LAKDDKNERFSPEETKKRFEAALRGARITGHKAKESIPKSRTPSKDKGKTKSDRSS